MQGGEESNIGRLPIVLDKTRIHQNGVIVFFDASKGLLARAELQNMPLLSQAPDKGAQRLATKRERRLPL
jgi:hypothetical protein